MKEKLIILWLRRDLRLADNPAFAAAASQGAVLPVYIDDRDDPWHAGAASRWALHQALDSLGKILEARGVPLLLRSGNPQEILRILFKETKASKLIFTARVEPYQQKRDAKIKKDLEAKDIEVEIFHSSTLFLPDEIKTKTGGAYKVYTPFSKACFAVAHNLTPPLPVPKRIKAGPKLRSERLAAWGFLPRKPNWAKSFEKHWKMSEKHAQNVLHDFIDGAMAAYKEGRNIPSKKGTSSLSPYLHFGILSPKQVWFAVRKAMETEKGVSEGSEVFLKEILWREFSYHLLHHAPNLPSKPLQKSFEKFPWAKRDKKLLMAWQKGQTGYPIIDAGMRQLWKEGWMHGRVRMIVASFLIKDLLIPWQEGEKWFWETLLDADLANNAASWQWVAGCGADAAPFFRIFNPVLQGEKYDPTGAYVRKYVPELAALEAKYIHQPWKASPESLSAAKVNLGENYPNLVVDHAFARKRALEALKKIKNP